MPAGKQVAIVFSAGTRQAGLGDYTPFAPLEAISGKENEAKTASSSMGRSRGEIYGRATVSDSPAALRPFYPRRDRPAVPPRSG